MPTAPSKAAVRFRERAELLDFLLSIADATSETLDLDRLLASVAAIVQDVVPSRSVRNPALQRQRAGACASDIPWDIVKRWSGTS